MSDGVYLVVAVAGAMVLVLIVSAVLSMMLQ